MLEVGMTDKPLPKHPRELNPLLLAYVGDAVYELYVRYYLVADGVNKPHELQQTAVRYVSAGAQAEAVRRVESCLTEEELDILKRGRNAKSKSVPRNAKATDYRYSTGVEALVGYWYLTGQSARLREMMETIIEATEEGKRDE
ncbi:mini-ribonuclease 3 [Marinithermofilum abyssi]|uniref:Mini-ribonuclease 3 n=1 Tax=Marinithermofilum abyssi TaxID=1571185 RepID=A0A8J2VD24_9BACL|nr:ribonuclease III domain-containing protein [Marinithermofilum abyssi]GGE21120.1 mini-ribonuclease 3 [Marinithermofilum abyssi]